MMVLVLFDLFKLNYVLVIQVEFIDLEIVVEYIMYFSLNGYGEVWGYLVKFVKMSGKMLVVVVVYENCGLNLYIEDVVW